MHLQPQASEISSTVQSIAQVCHFLEVADSKNGRIVRQVSAGVDQR